MSHPTARNPSAGSAEPYWFEWKTGLLYLIELLDVDSEIEAVGFQLRGPKGWDDIGLRFRNGTIRLVQTKHSRANDHLTFGDLVVAEPESKSLLRTLANAWRDERAARGNVECVLVTNRTAGSRWHKDRPPLNSFFEKLTARVGKAASVDDIKWDREDERYATAFATFATELSDLSDADKLAFIQALRVETGAPDLPVLETKIRERLMQLTGLPPSSINGLFNAVVANLRGWTCQTLREREWIDRETLRSALAGDEDQPLWLGHCEVETPEPFFPSRYKVVDDLRESLLHDATKKIDFLAAEPGAGKTSCVSKLARSGAILWRDQPVSIRFYAYRPSQTGQTDTGGDADVGVRRDALWLALLWQIREYLRRTHLLAQLRVPVWLDGMPWEIAREHVLRIGESLGQQWGRPFVICVDGIDHAARARRKGLTDFLETLPPPNAVPEHVRFLLAGQPPEAYPEYPFFLRQQHTAVKVHAVDVLSDDDLRALWRAANPAVRSSAEDAIIRLLVERAQRRTLPTVYAAEDIRTCTSLEDAGRVLDDRPLVDSLHEYYERIWSVAVPAAVDAPRLAAAFGLLRERPTGSLLASAFSNLAKSEAEWTDIMRRLRPLVRETAAGFELVHNDLRVHLDASLANEPLVRRDAAAALADHYRKPTSNRLAAHGSLLDLLRTAGETDTFADDFTADWVIEAAAERVAHTQLADECSVAFVAAVNRKDWLLLHRVACASLTLYRLEECGTSDEDDPTDSKIIPAFVRVEGEPLPVELWSPTDFFELLSSCEQLVDARCERRAASVLQQWLGELSVEMLIGRLTARPEDAHRGLQDRDAIRRGFERLGRLCGVCGFMPARDERSPESKSNYLAAFESGWVAGLALLPDRSTALRLWNASQPRFIASWVEATKEGAKTKRWGEVRALLNRLESSIDRLNPADQLALGWIAARAKPRNTAVWQQPLSVPNYGLPLGATSLSTLRGVAKWITYTDPTREPAQVAEDLLPLLDQRGMDSKDPAAVALLIRGSAVAGQLLRYVDRDDYEGARTAVPPSTLRPLVEALWCTRPDWKNLPHDEVHTAGDVGTELVEIAWSTGKYHALLADIAKTKFADYMLWDEGTRAFDIVWECGEHDLLEHAVRAKAVETIERLHENDTASRNGIVANLLHFTGRLGLHEFSKNLRDRLRRTRLGYTSHKEWVFAPLARWFELVRHSTPAAWRDDGVQLLALDRVSERQNGDNRFGDDLTAEVAAAAMQCGAWDFETLFGFLVSRGAKHPLWDLAKASRDGFEICLREHEVISAETALSRTAIAIAVGRWPAESASITVDGILNAEGVPPDVRRQPGWIRAVEIATEIQGPPRSNTDNGAEKQQPTEPREQRSAETILDDILNPGERSWINLRDIASLAAKAREDNHPNRSALVAAALDALESDRMALSRCIDFHDISVMSRLYENLSETERWRLLGAMTAVTGELRRQLSGEPNWAFMSAFSAVDLACRARAAGNSSDFAVTAFHQLLGTHWSWHGVAPTPGVSVQSIPTSWPDAARRMLLSLLRSDACETVYMAMTGLRFYAECFPHQISSVCRDGLAQEHALDVILALAQLWATQKPESLGAVLAEFASRESIGSLEDRLDAWAVSALHSGVTKAPVRRFKLPDVAGPPQLAFPGDAQLFEDEAHMNGLMRHNSFAKMANSRLHRVGIALGSMERAFRHMTRAVRDGRVEFPSMMLPQPKILAFDSSTPRQRHKADEIVGEAVMSQCTGETWSPAKAAAVRLLLGFGMDPWIASATPNIWSDKESWPSDFDVERWIEAGAAKTDDVAFRLTALVQGDDLDPGAVLLGAILHIPTYRRDLQFDYWLVAPGVAEEEQPKILTGRTLAGWFAGWSFAAKSPKSTSVHFVGTCINYPNSDLDITPTHEWESRWGWHIDPKNNLRFLTNGGDLAAWYERWVGPELSHRRLARQPMLNRWVAHRDSFPPECNELRQWTRQSDMSSGLLTSPE